MRRINIYLMNKYLGDLSFIFWENLFLGDLFPFVEIFFSFGEIFFPFLGDLLSSFGKFYFPLGDLIFLEILFFLLGDLLSFFGRSFFLLGDLVSFMRDLFSFGEILFLFLGDLLLFFGDLFLSCLGDLFFSFGIYTHKR